MKTPFSSLYFIHDTCDKRLIDSHDPTCFIPGFGLTERVQQRSRSDSRKYPFFIISFVITIFPDINPPLLISAMNSKFCSILLKSSQFFTMPTVTRAKKRPASKAEPTAPPAKKARTGTKKTVSPRGKKTANDKTTEPTTAPEFCTPGKGTRNPRWKHKGKEPLTDIKDFPKGWNPYEPDLDPK